MKERIDGVKIKKIQLNKKVSFFWGLLSVIIVVFLFFYFAKEHSKNDELLAVTPFNLNSPHIPPKQEVLVQNIQNISTQKIQKEPYIAECDKPVDQNDVLSKKYFDEKVIALVNDTEKLIPLLEESSSMESQITTALISKSNDINELSKELKKLKEKYSNNRLLSYDLLSSCTSPSSQCDRSLIDHGIDQDPNNGAVWLLSALYELNNNNIEQASEDLLKASNSSVYEEYWGEHFSLFEVAFSEAGTGNDLPAQLAVMGYVASTPLPNFGVLVQYCKDIDSREINILNACLSMGERMSNESATQLSYLIGLSLQESSYKKLQNEDQELNISDKRKEFMNLIGLSNKASDLVWQSSRRTYDWLQQIKDSGEVSATEYIVDEAIRLSLDPSFDPCEINW